MMKKTTTILVADDHPIFRNGLRDMIASDPSLHLVAQAADGEQALRMIRECRPEIAILDFQMPKQTGMQVLRSIWKEKLPVKGILLTMYDDEELFNEAMSLQVAGFVLKESAATDLVTAIEFALANKLFISPALSDLLVRRRRDERSLQKGKPGLQTLTVAEQRILKMVAEDRTTKEIAHELKISLRTVETHRQNICYKLQLSGSHSLLKFAYDNKAHL